MQDNKTRMSAKQRKAIIIDAVLALADIDGPDRLSTAAIAKASGLTHAGIFRHFPTKQDIWLAVASEIANRAKNHWSKPLERSLDPKEKIMTLVLSHFELLNKNPAILTIMFSYELQQSNKELREIFTHMMMSFRQHIAEQFILAGYDNERAFDLSFLIIALLQGIGMRWSVSQRGFDLSKEGIRLLKVQLDLIDFNQMKNK